MPYVSKRKLFTTLALCITALLIAGTSFATPQVRFASVNWTGVSVKSALGVSVLESLGYKSTSTVLSVPIVYEALSMGDADIFLGNWMPSMASIAGKFFKKGTVIQYKANMPGAKYTLAVPAYVYNAGLKDFSDIAQYADKLDHKIYGIEPGNDGNKIIKSMIDQNLFGLGGFKLVETSEPIMLTEVKSLVRQKKWVVFLGWAPHYMNSIIDMKYLTGSTEATFGAHNGTATVYTNIRKGFAEEQPNVAVFLKNFTFPIPMMNEISLMLRKDKRLTRGQAGLIWVKKHPEIYQGWLKGVKTVEGKPALPAFVRYLQNH